MMNMMDDSKSKGAVAMIMDGIDKESSTHEESGKPSNAGQALIDAIKSSNAKDVEKAFEALMMKCENDQESYGGDSAEE